MSIQGYTIESESPAAADMLFWSIVGHEGLSRPSAYELTVLSPSEQIDPLDVLGHAFDVVIEFTDPHDGVHRRHCQGHAVRVVRVGPAGRYFAYRIQLRSWFWLLTKRTNCRIHQDRTALEVMDATFDDSAIKRFKKVNPGGVAGTHPSRGYCVQFEESDHAFVSRLLEDEGIYYWFDAHDMPGTMLLADGPGSAHDKLPVVNDLGFAAANGGEPRFNDVIRWCDARSLESGRYASRDRNFKRIRTTLSSEGDASAAHELADLEVFEFPGGYFNVEAAGHKGESRLDEMSATRRHHWALTHWPDVAVGRTFSFHGDPTGARDGDYLVAGCSFVAVHSGYEGLAMALAEGSAGGQLRALMADDAVNAGNLDLVARIVGEEPLLHTGRRGTALFLVTALPAEISFKPPRLTPRVRMPGPQSAIVVGPKGEEQPENGQDLYVDDMGRVKVFFYWNRYEPDSEQYKGQKWSCWLRVSQPWAGKGWGGYFAPRIGQEVIVGFMEGSPDRPFVLGRVYNDDQPIPYDSPTQSGFRTRSTPGGGPAHYNEIMFEDKKGSENINIHAERNMSRSVEADDATTVGHDQSVTVVNDRTVTTRGNEKREVVKDQRNVVHQHQHTNVTWCQYNHIGQHQQNIIGADGQLNEIAGKVETYIGQTMALGVTGAMTQKSASLAVDTGPATFTLGSLALQAKTTLHMTAGAEAKLNFGTTEITSNGSRSDWVQGEHKFKADTFKYFGTNFNRTVVEANDCIMGNNANAYIGIASDTKIAMARSTFVGMNMAAALALDIGNFVGVKMENCAAIKLATAAGISIEMSSVKNFVPGGGAGGGADAPTPLTGWAGDVAAFLMGASMGGPGVMAAYDAYQAVAQYEQAAEECQKEGMTELARLARRRAGMVKGAAAGALAGGAVLGPLGAVAGGVAGGLAGDHSGIATPPAKT
ncbi:type VI secretion system tip protein TssI/VgrG [uncultured Pseudacidovorax sp.]|uniref:type VI secretion system Vgr family protein n=1 Tax=uncultured Pseudacidovorax sp. TaxID=679313 RepID=UPI0025D2F43E|nr:type VI secretion system tip protein TssI/VgrG [uncultured Pseudacidovorax sp.]